LRLFLEVEDFLVAGDQDCSFRINRRADHQHVIAVSKFEVGQLARFRLHMVAAKEGLHFLYGGRRHLKLVSQHFAEFFNDYFTGHQLMVRQNKAEHISA